MAISVHDLDLPEVELIDLDRHEAMAALAAARERHWLARTPLGYVVNRHEDVTAILRERRFHTALSLIPQMAGIDDSEFLERRRRSILSVEGEDHARLRRLVAPPSRPSPPTGSAHPCAGWSTASSTRSRPRAAANSSRTSVSRIPSRSSASCLAHPRAIGSCSRAGPPTSSGSSTTTSPTTCRVSKPRRKNSTTTCGR